MECRLGWLLATMSLVLMSCQSAPPVQVASPSPAASVLPPTIVGVITAIDRRVLVELAPGTTIGDKIYFTVTSDTQVGQHTAAGLQPRAQTDLAVGQRVQVWDAGVVLESYPGQADARRIVIMPTPRAAPDDAGAGIPQRAPDVSGIITQATNTLWIDDRTVVILTPNTRFYRRSGSVVEAVDAAAVALGQRVDIWVDALQFAPTPQGTIIALVITEE